MECVYGTSLLVANIIFYATSSVVKQRAGSKRLLYYEISCQNLKSGDLRVPVAAFLSNDHTVSTISNFLHVFSEIMRKKCLVTVPKLSPVFKS